MNSAPFDLGVSASRRLGVSARTLDRHERFGSPVASDSSILDQLFTSFGFSGPKGGAPVNVGGIGFPAKDVFETRHFDLVRF